MPVVTKRATLCDVPQIGRAESERQTSLFLMDGLCTAPSPVLMVVGDVGMVGQVALHVHDGSARWDDRPARVGRLLRLDLAGVAGYPADTVGALVSELAGTDDWAYLPDVGVLLESSAGRHFLDKLMTSVADGGVAAVIASVTREALAQLTVECPRLMGFATVLAPSDSEPGGLTYTRSIVSNSVNPEDVGWLVVVRYELTQDIAADADSATTPTDGRLQLVDNIHLIVRDDVPPLGVIRTCILRCLGCRVGNRIVPISG